MYRSPASIHDCAHGNILHLHTPKKKKKKRPGLVVRIQAWGDGSVLSALGETLPVSRPAPQLHDLLYQPAPDAFAP